MKKLAGYVVRHVDCHRFDEKRCYAIGPANSHFCFSAALRHRIYVWPTARKARSWIAAYRKHGVAPELRGQHVLAVRPIVKVTP